MSSFIKLFVHSLEGEVKMGEWRNIFNTDRIKLMVRGNGEEIFFDEREQKKYKGRQSGFGKFGECEYVLISGKYLSEQWEEIKNKKYEEGYRNGVEDGKKAYEQELLEKQKHQEHLKELKFGSRGREPIPDEKVRLIKEMHLGGHSVRSIAKTVGVGVGTVQKYSK